MSDSGIAITISRELGSGGAYIGQHLAEKLGILYADREIVSRAAKELRLIEEDVETRDEKKTSFWESVLQAGALGTPEMYVPPDINLVSDRELFETESKAILEIVREHSAVIIGRCGSYLLRDHPSHVSVYLHADLSFRLPRVEKVFNTSSSGAAKLIERSDRDRAQYIHAHTGRRWNDALQYHLALDTGILGLDQATDLILDYIGLRFGTKK
jgi:CMP/dCMP kinase